MISFIFFISMFFMTLYSYYFYEIGLPIVPIFGYFLLILVVYLKKRNIKLNKNIFYLFSAVIIVFIFGTFPSILMNYSVDIKSTLGFLLAVTTFFIIYENFENYEFKIVINILIKILVFFWLVHFIYYHYFGEFIDFLAPFTGEEQRQTFWISGVVRPTSLFTEPSMYCNTMLIFFYIRLLLKNFKLSFFDYLIILTFYLSFSSYGIIVISIFLVSLLLRKLNLKKIIYIIMVFLIISFVIIYFDLLSLESIDTLIERLLNPLGDQSGKDRVIGSIFDFFNETTILTQLFGFGLGNAQYNAYLVSNGIFYLIMNVGIIGFMFFMIVFFVLLIQTKHAVLNLLIFLLSIVNGPIFTYHIWWVTMAIIYKIDKKTNKDVIIFLNKRKFYKYKSNIDK
jgi:hypothetical protein